MEAFDACHPKHTLSICNRSEHSSLASGISIIIEIGVSPKTLGLHNNNHGMHVLRSCTAVDKEESLFKVFTGAKIENPTDLRIEWKDMCK